MQCMLIPSYHWFHCCIHAVKIVGTDQPSYTVTEGEDSQVDFNVVISGALPGQGRSCVVTITTVPGSAVGK